MNIIMSTCWKVIICLWLAGLAELTISLKSRPCMKQKKNKKVKKKLFRINFTQ